MTKQNEVDFTRDRHEGLTTEAARLVAEHWFAMGYRYRVTERGSLWDMEIIRADSPTSPGPR